MNELDADIARLLAVHHNRKRLGYSYYETSGHAARSAQGRPLRADRGIAQRDRASRAGGYQFRPGYLQAELDRTELTLTFALAGLDVRGAA